MTRYRFWERLDTLAHINARFLPRRLVDWVCDRYERTIIEAPYDR